MLCAWNSLREDTTGHTWHRQGAAVEAIQRSVVGARVNPEAAIELGLRGGWLDRREDPPSSGYYYLAESEKARAERRLADSVRRLLRSCTVMWPAVPDPATSPVPSHGMSPRPTEHQRERATQALSRPLGVLSGTPGTGKTFLAAAVIRLVVDQFGRDAVAVCAPTGKAAVRVTAAMQRYGLRITATTIHRLLEIGRNGRDGKGWGFLRNAANPLEQRFLFVDEASMLDCSLAADLADACADGTHVLLVGDPYQLPPVGHGAPLRDLLAAGVPNGELTEIRRNAGMIVQACRSIKEGKKFETCDKFDPEAGANLRHIETPADQPGAAVEVLRQVLRRFKASGKFDPIWDVQVLTPLNAKTPVSRVELNRMLQGELNPAGATAEPNPFRIHDKIICLKNSWMQKVELKTTRRDGSSPADPANYIDVQATIMEPKDVFLANGDVGRVLAVAPRQTVARFSDPDRLVRIPMGKVKEGDEERWNEGEGAESKGTGCDFALAYAVTYHKSQGSEWPVVILMADKNAGMVACRELWYTGVSRASKLAILIGPRQVVDRQCKVVSLPRRKTFLKELLTA